jgi:SM-20-related protein
MAEFRDEPHAGSPFLAVIPALAERDGLAAVLADGLRASDAVLVEEAFRPAQIAGLHAESTAAYGRRLFAAARMGRERTASDALRGDQICWLEASADAPAATALLAELDALRVDLDRTLLLGARSVEAQYSCYAAGTHYARHLDRFDASSHPKGCAASASASWRVLSLVLYLNHDWTAADGGALRLYDAADQPHDVLPLGGRLVAFLSDRVAHEVLPPARTRWSVAAWLRRDA